MDVTGDRSKLKSDAVKNNTAQEPGMLAKIPHASRPKNQNIKQKQHCNRFNKEFKKKKKVPKKKKCKKAKRLSEVALQVAENRSKRQRRKGKIYPSECRDPKIARRDKKAFLSDQCKEIEENHNGKKNRNLQELSREHFMERRAQ